MRIQKGTQPKLHVLCLPKLPWEDSEREGATLHHVAHRWRKILELHVFLDGIAQISVKLAVQGRFPVTNLGLIETRQEMHAVLLDSWHVHLYTAGPRQASEAADELLEEEVELLEEDVGGGLRHAKTSDLRKATFASSGAERPSRSTPASPPEASIVNVYEFRPVRRGRTEDVNTLRYIPASAPVLSVLTPLTPCFCSRNREANAVACKETESWPFSDTKWLDTVSPVRASIMVCNAAAAGTSEPSELWTDTRLATLNEWSAIKTSGCRRATSEWMEGCT